MHKFKVISFCIVFIILVSVITKIIDVNDYSNNSEITSDRIAYMQNHEKELNNVVMFVESKLSGKSGGIYTNYIDTQYVKPHSTGHEYLSESEGLMMLYYVSNNQKEKFDNHYNIVVNTFLNESGSIRWRIKDGNKEIGNTTATIDDLRIIRALMLAGQKWQDEKYHKTINFISNSLYKNSAKNNLLVDYYNINTKERASVVTLSYIDLLTLKKLNKINKNWVNIYNTSYKILKDGYSYDHFPFYCKEYNIENKKYNYDQEVNMIDALLPILHIVEIGEAQDKAIKWLKDELKNNHVIYARYYVNNIKYTSIGNTESTAVYSLAMRIAKEIEDEQLYEDLFKKLIKLQVKTINSEIYGSFGDEDSLKVYSFDNLQGILALD